MDCRGLDWKHCEHLSGWELTWESHLTEHLHHIAKHWSDSYTASLCTYLVQIFWLLRWRRKDSSELFINNVPKCGHGDWSIRDKLGWAGSKEGWQLSDVSVEMSSFFPADPNFSDPYSSDVSVELESSLRPVDCLQSVLGWQSVAVAESANSLARWWPATRDSIAAITHPPSAAAPVRTPQTQRSGHLGLVGKFPTID